MNGMWIVEVDDYASELIVSRIRNAGLASFGR
jgi:hypothetical protein